MSRAKAHAILDAVRAGVYYPESVILRALIATGDLVADHPPLRGDA